MLHVELMLRDALRYRARQIARAHTVGLSREHCGHAMTACATVIAPRFSSVPSDLAHEWAAEIIAEEIELVHDAVESLCTDISRGWFRWAATNW